MKRMTSIILVTVVVNVLLCVPAYADTRCIKCPSLPTADNMMVGNGSRWVSQSLAACTATDFVIYNAATDVLTCGPAGGVTIGQAVTGGTANRVLFTGATGLLADDADFTFDGTRLGLATGTATDESFGPAAATNMGCFWETTVGTLLCVKDTLGGGGIELNNGILFVTSTGRIGFNDDNTISSALNIDSFFMRRAANSIQMGATAATPSDQTLSAPDSNSGNNVGGGLTILGGAGSGTQAGGAVNVNAGAAGSSGGGGAVAITAANGAGGSGAGGVVVITGGTGAGTGAGGNISLLPGNSSGTRGVLRIRNHIDADGVSAPTLSACGTSPSLATGSRDIAGKITVGTGATTSCTLTFAVAYTGAPACVVSGSSNAITYGKTTTTTALVVTSSASMASNVLMYMCMGFNE